MSRTTRWAMAGVAAVVAAMAACPASSADDAPPKADAPKPLTLRLAPGKAYLYRYRETCVDRVTVDSALAAGLPLETRTGVVWDVGLTLQRVEANGDLFVSLLPTRVRGTIEAPFSKPRTFDSDDPKTPVTSPILGRGIRVTLSPTGRVLDAQGPGYDVPDQTPPDVKALISRFDPGLARLVAQQVLQDLPSEVPRAGRSWESTRGLPPQWQIAKDTLHGRGFGDAVEKSTVESADASVVTAGFVARGKRDIRRVADPIDLGTDAARLFAALGEQLEEWLVTGDVRIRRDTGLAELRTTSCTLATHVNPLRLSKEMVAKAPTLPAEAAQSPAADHSYEITTRLELVEVR